MKRLGLLAALSLATLSFPPGLSAEAPAAVPSGAAPAPSAAPPAPSGAARDAARERRDRLLEQLRERGLVVPSGLPSALPAPSASVVGLALPPGLAEELSRRTLKLRETRQQRREQHRVELERELGARLRDPAVLAELKLHATRVAELARIRFLAETARSGPARDKLLTRVTRLTAREEQRHQARVAALSARPTPAPSASSAPPAPPASGATP